jgi:L-ascorbate oxidase
MTGAARHRIAWCSNSPMRWGSTAPALDLAHVGFDRFSLVSTTGADGQEIPVDILNTNALLDNVPVPHGTDLKGDGTGCDGTIDAWRAGTCKPRRVIVEIPFKEIGDFVYHCHILEHEDGGMMAKISVVPNGGS